MELLIAIIIFFGGLFAGIVNTIVGGGSLISIPLLIFTGLSSYSAIGTNRFAMIFNTGTSAVEYYKKIKFKLGLAFLLSILASVGSYLGAITVLEIEEKTLNYIIGILMLFLMFFILYKNKLGLKESKKRLTKINYLYVGITTLFLGFYGGFFGAGISTMFMFMFVLLFGMSFLTSSGITRLIVAISSIVATLVFYLNTKIDFFIGIILTISFIIGAKIGVILALKGGNVWIRRLFIILIFLNSIKLLFF